jgi:multicomponent K+:H+ antiporter subunit D
VSELWQTLSDHWVTLPLILPLVGAFLTPVVGHKRINVRRVVTAITLLATVAAGLFAVEQAATGTMFTYEVSGWRAPFGIVLVIDRLSAAMIAMTSVLALGAYLYAIFGVDKRAAYFHFLFQVQVAGINGAFLTGDLFNLFVFFEILLIASYNLLAYGGGKKRTKAAIHYVVLNLTSSALFLVGVGTLYGLTGTLNMADMAAKIATLPAADEAIARSGAILLTLVFGIKAALLPLYFWLPRAYGNATAPVAALFAVMTKVGIYAIMRTSTLIFGDGAEVVAGLTDGWLIPMALVTMLAGALGVAAARRLQVLVAYLIIVSVGTILVPVAVRTPDALAAAIYYLVHSTFISGALFLIAGLVASKRGEAGDSLVEGPAIARPSWLGLMFFVAALVVIGLPPTSGFIGKVLVLKGTSGHEAMGWIWLVVLGVSLLSLVALALAGSHLFWRTEVDTADEPLARPSRAIAPLFLLAIVAGWTAFAGPAYDYAHAAANQLLDRDGYIQTIDPASFDPSKFEGKKGHGGEHKH